MPDLLQHAKSRSPSHTSSELDPEEEEEGGEGGEDEPISEPRTSAKHKQKSSGPPVVANSKDPGQPTTSNAYPKRKVAPETLAAPSKTQKRSRK
jgi:hypothetical protein